MPVGRGCGVPVPPDGRPCGSVTPWRSRHCRKAEFREAFCDVPEPDDDEDDDELALQPVTARAAVSMTAPSTPGLAARPGTLWDRRVNNVSLTDYRPAHVAPAGLDRVSRLVQSMGRALRFRCARLRAFCPAARAFGRARGGKSRSGHAFHTGGQQQPDVEGCPLTRLGVDDDLSAVGGH